MFLLNNYSFLFSYRCAVDKTVKFHPTNDKRTQKFSLEAFAFLGDHMFVYLHCRVKICNASDPNSRCAQGCIRRAKRAVTTLETKDDEVTLAQGPFKREDNDAKTELQETQKDLRDLGKGGKFKFHSSTANNQAIFSHPFGHTRVLKTLTFKEKLLSEKPFVWKWVLFVWEQKKKLFSDQWLGTVNPRFETDSRTSQKRPFIFLCYIHVIVSARWTIESRRVFLDDSHKFLGYLRKLIRHVLSVHWNNEKTYSLFESYMS